jgi:hypothetical protein
VISAGPDKRLGTSDDVEFLEEELRPQQNNGVQPVEGEK